ncbi:MAG: thioredoxin domain-containing protein [Pseudomonadota bacterium]
MRPQPRRALLSSLALLVLAACGAANGDDTADISGEDAAPMDMVLGEANAPVTLVEYASITCGACLQFHRDVLPTIKADYVEAGLVKFVFREFPTPPQNVAVAGFALARCAGPEAYFDVIDDMFEAQPGLLAAARQGAVRPALQTIAERHGIAGDEAFDACLSDRAIRQTIADVILSGEEFSVSSTPTLILQGQKLENSFQARTSEGLSELIDLELAALGIMPPTDAAPEEATVEDNGEAAAEETAETEADPETASE